MLIDYRFILFDKKIFNNYIDIYRQLIFYYTLYHIQDNKNNI